jgi:maltooligosyltrehalose trehalohydrolase
MISEGRKKEFVAFGWTPDQIPDPQDEQTFLQSKLNWAEVTEQPHRSLLQWHKDLISLRRTQSQLTDGNLNAVNVRFDEQAQWLVLERGNLRVACNLGQAPVNVEVGEGSRILLASDDSIALTGASVTLGPDSVAVMSVGVGTGS